MEVISRKEAIEKGLKVYFTGKPCKYGHVAERYVSIGYCVECSRVREQRDKRKEYRKKYYKNNAEQKKEWQKQWREENPEYNKQYYNDNKEVINEYDKHYRRLRYATDEDFKTSRICRNMLKRTLKATSSTKGSRTYELLGYCNEELKTSIESKLLPGMTWDSYGDWHIDHIYPVARHIRDGVEDPDIINALDNLMPMWAEHNLEKGDRTLEEYLDDRKDLVELYGRFL